jgi:DNA-binding CsgD family transcriptional regulator
MLVGREGERERIAALLAGGGALVLRGGPGTGKTALLAEHEGLRATATRAEADMPFAALHQLLRPLLGRAGGPLRHALAARPTLPRERMEASLALLDLLAAEAPLALLVDDAHLLDAASADALAFAARRLDGEAVAILLAARPGGPASLCDLPELTLDGLPEPLARDLLPADLAPHVRDAVVALAAGNPLALTELPAMLTPAQRAGREPLPEPLPVGPGVRGMFPGQLPDLLFLVAADETGELGVLRAAAGRLGLDPGGPDDLEEAGLLRIAGGRAELAHPLLRAVVHAEAGARRHREAHLALAEVLDADRRVWHRALAAEGPDEEIAGELERAAPEAARRRGHATAAAMLERAAQLTPDGQQRARRLVAAAEAHWLAGRTERVGLLLAQAEALPGDPEGRAAAAMLRGSAQLDAGSPAEAYEVLLAGARQAASGDPMLALEMLTRAAEASWMTGRIEWIADLGGLAAQVASGDGDEESFMVALLRGVGQLLRDEGEDGAAVLRDALALASTLPRPRHQLLACIVAVWLGDVSAGLTATRTAVAALRASGERAELSFALQQLGAFECWEGRLATAHGAASEAVALATENRQDLIHAHALAVLARIEAMQGDAERSRAHALQSLEASVARGLGLPAAAALWALGRLEVCLGRPEDALSHLLAVTAPQNGFASPVPALLSCPDLVEAAVRGGRPELAEPSLAVFEDWHRRTGSAWGAGVAHRMRALMAEAEDAEPLFLAALDDADRQPMIEVARTRLHYGELLRRARRKLDARDQLRAALTVFESVGAEPWAERARAELRASGEGHARPRDGGALDELTPQEREIALLVAGGATNREVAAQLFLSVRTVEYHLHKVYTRLGITSRVALAGAINASAADPAGRAPSTPR